jgi:hypothetical protein
MKINKSELKKALETVKPGLANRESFDQATSFAFTNGCVVTYNDEISISHPISIDIEGAVQAEELYKFIAKASTDEIEIETTDDSITLKSGRAKAGFLLAKEIKLPLEDEILKKGKWTDLPETFIVYLQFASMSCSVNLTDPKLTCVHVNKKGFIESSDNHRIFHYDFEKPFGFKTFLIPQSSVRVITKLNPVKITDGKGWVHFKNSEGTVISCRTFNEEYVDTSPFLKLAKGGTKLTFPETLSEILDRAIIFTEEEKVINSSVDIEIQNKKLVVKSKSETAWFEESARIKYEGETLTFTIVNYLLKDILSLTNGGSIFEKILFFKGENWVYITSLR